VFIISDKENSEKSENLWDIPKPQIESF